MLKAVFFDAAGTLFHPREPVGSTYARIAREFGLDAPDSTVSAGFHRAFASASGLAFGPGRSASELRELERNWWRELVRRSFAGLGEFRDFDAFFIALFSYFATPSSWVTDPEVAATLDRLKSQNLTVGVISNFDYRLYRILDGLGLASRFDSITISSEAGYSKPRHEVFVNALSKHSVRAAEALHIGDSEELDYRGGAAVGMCSALIDASAEESIEGAGRLARIHSLASVPALTGRLRFA